MTKKKLPVEVKINHSKCQRCKKLASRELHPCPYRADIYEYVDDDGNDRGLDSPIANLAGKSPASPDCEEECCTCGGICYIDCESCN